MGPFSKTHFYIFSKCSQNPSFAEFLCCVFIYKLFQFDFKIYESQNRAWRKPVFLFLWKCGKERRRGEGTAEEGSRGDGRREKARGRGGRNTDISFKTKVF